jgi:acyl-CoA reductase-like NAD-dependent aldehyde dehydrogenase
MAATSDQFVETFQPAHPSRVAARYQYVDDIAVDRALDQAHGAQVDWVRSAPVRSAALHSWANALEKDADHLAEVLVQEVGKPINEAVGEVARGVAILRYYAQAVYDPVGEEYPSPDGRARLRVARVPLGTVGLITPWNFPLAIPLWKIAPALAYGNAVIWKPSSLATGIALEIIARSREFLPDGIVSFVPVTRRQADRLVDDPRLDGISFTGSAAVGSDLAARAARRGVAVQAEMGGQNPSIVLPDADLDHAAATIAGAAMAYAGQKCTATSRVLVADSVAGRFVPLLVDHIRALRVGEPSDPATTVGPLISQEARAKVHESIQAARLRGADCLTGGDALDREGWFLQPTLLSVTDTTDAIVQEETFGPVASVLRFDRADEAIRIANSTRFGLSAAVFGSNLHDAAEVANGLSTGLVRINASTTGVDFYTPFGGVRASSYGPREMGRAAREFYTTTRTLLVNDLTKH